MLTLATCPASEHSASTRSGVRASPITVQMRNESRQCGTADCSSEFSQKRCHALQPSLHPPWRASCKALHGISKVWESQFCTQAAPKREKRRSSAATSVEEQHKGGGDLLKLCGCCLIFPLFGFFIVSIFCCKEGCKGHHLFSEPHSTDDSGSDVGFALCFIDLQTAARSCTSQTTKRPHENGSKNTGKQVLRMLGSVPSSFPVALTPTDLRRKAKTVKQVQVSITATSWPRAKSSTDNTLVSLVFLVSQKNWLCQG